MQSTQRLAAVTMQGIVKDFQSGDAITHALCGIDLEVFPGELVMLVGPSGCGKTTLLSIITGILTPTAGDVFINDVKITALTDDEKVIFRRNTIGFIFQQYNLFPALTAAENATIPLIAAQVPRLDAIKKAVHILDKMGMEKCLSKQPIHLSGGEQQRVAIARALIHDPSLIVCDEPTSALDAHTGELVMEILRSIVLNEGRMVVVVTHDSRIFHFADRIIYMNDGKIVREETQYRSLT